MNRVGYVQTVTPEVTVGAHERVEIVVRMSRSVIRLRPLTVVSRGVDPRQLATWEGFQARYLERRDVGSSRLWSRDDPLLNSAMTVRQLLRWVPGRRRCIVVFVDGERRVGWPPEFVLDLSTAHVRGVEFYARPLQAPLEYREGGECGVLAIWRR